MAAPEITHLTTSALLEKSSALCTLMQMTESGTSLQISLEDLTGITFDYKALRLPPRYRKHSSVFCQEAKRSMRFASSASCLSNKYRANQEVIQAEAVVVGTCYLGLTDICQPWIYNGQLWGIFYLGSVLTKETIDSARLKIERAISANSGKGENLLSLLESVPCIEQSDIAVYTNKLQGVIEILNHVLDGLSVPSDVYKTFDKTTLAEHRKTSMHPLVMRAMRLIRDHHEESLRLPDIAGFLNCHPGYLGRLFKKHAGFTASDYLHQVRIERACRMLRLGDLDIASVAYQVGYQHKSNFGRSFRKLMHVSASEYREQYPASK